MAIILLIRHGHASIGKLNYDALSALGRTQAAVLGSTLKARGIKPSAIVSGEMERQRDTARLITESMESHRTVTVDPGWNEYDHQDILAAHKPLYRNSILMRADLARTLKPIATFDRTFNEAIQRWVDGDLPCRESFSAFGQRIMQALTRSAERESSGPVLVVTSAGPVSWVATNLINAGPTAWPTIKSTAVNTGVTKVISSKRGLSLISLNDHSHLEHDRSLITYR